MSSPLVTRSSLVSPSCGCYLYSHWLLLPSILIWPQSPLHQYPWSPPRSSACDYSLSFLWVLLPSILHPRILLIGLRVLPHQYPWSSSAYSSGCLGGHMISSEHSLPKRLPPRLPIRSSECKSKGGGCSRGGRSGGISFKNENLN